MEKNPGVKIGFSKFAMLRPNQVMLSSQTPANVCNCIYHQNVILALDALHAHIPSVPVYKDFPDSLVQ